MSSLTHRSPRLTHLLAGTLVSAASLFFVSEWHTIFNQWLGMSIVYDTRPGWLVVLMIVVTWLPLIAIATLIVLRVARGPAYRPLAFAIGAATPYLYAFAVLFLGPPVEGYLKRRPFDPSTWKAHQARDPAWPDRLRMVDDLLATRLPTGLSRDSVMSLLGPPDETAYWKEWDLVYWLGPERGTFRIDSEWLVLRFGEDGRLAEYRIVRD